MTLPHRRSLLTNFEVRKPKGSVDRALGRWLSLGDDTLPTFGLYASTTLVRSPMGSPVEVHLFPGRSAASALVIGGVHGNEFIGVEVTRRLLSRLRAECRRNQRPYFTTIVVPALFPDNLPASHGGNGRGRRSTRNRADPNRQFPAIGTAIDASVRDRPDRPTDARGRPIEGANIALMELIRRSRPCRIASVHAIRKPCSVGIFSDPHPEAGEDLSAEAADLAERMHGITRRFGGHVSGNASSSGSYPHQGTVDDQGISLGAWASRAIETGPHSRAAIPVITLELKRDWPAGQARRRHRYVDAFMLAIRRGFLEPQNP